MYWKTKGQVKTGKKTEPIMAVDGWLGDSKQRKYGGKRA